MHHAAAVLLFTSEFCKLCVQLINIVGLMVL